MKRKIFVLVIIGLMILIFGFLNYNYGLLTQYNYITARFNIKKGKLELVACKEESITGKEEVEIAPLYKFRYVLLENCTNDSSNVRGRRIYNRLMLEAISEKNNGGWKRAYENTIDSLFRIRRIDTIKQVILNMPEIKRLQEPLPGDSLNDTQLEVYINSYREGDIEVMVGEELPNCAIAVYRYYRVNPYTLSADRIFYEGR